MPSSRYHKALWLGNGYTTGSYTGGPWKIVLHTTETRTLPGYNRGKSAPHLTYDPRTRKWWQHTDLLKPARSLRDAAGGVRTNRDQALQLEIICYSAKSIGDSVGGLWVGHLTAVQLADIAEWLAWCSVQFGVKMRWPGRQALSYAEANSRGFRMRPAVWDAWDGIAGHQHVPEGNNHWDPGAIDWGALMGLEKEEDVLQRGDKSRDVTILQGMLNTHPQKALWTPLGIDGDFGPATEESVKKFQRYIGLDITGVANAITLSVLAGQSQVPSEATVSGTVSLSSSVT